MRNRETVSQYEDVIKDEELPVNVFLRSSDSGTEGYEFHWHEELEIYYVVSGGVCLLCGGNAQWLYSGDVGFVNWCEPHRGNRFLDGTKHYIIQIGTKLFENETVRIPAGRNGGKSVSMLALLASRGRAFPGVIRGSEELTGLLDVLIREKEERLSGFELRVRAAVLEILAFLLRRADLSGGESPAPMGDSASMEHLRKLLFYLSAHCTEPEAVSLAALSRQFGLSVPYLCRIFKASTNLTLNAYVNELRCNRAASLIRDGVALSRAAELTGFRDYNYFSRVFKKITGRAPSAYRDG